MGVGEDDGYEGKEFGSDCSCSIFYPSSSVKLILDDDGRSKGIGVLRFYLSTNNCIVLLYLLA